MLKFKKIAGFTLIELIVVIVVIGILATIAIVSYNGVTSQARQTSLQSDAKNDSVLLENYRSHSHTYPQNPADANGGNSLPASDGNTISYKVSSVGRAYCVAASNNGVSFRKLSTSDKIESGNCDAVNLEPCSNLAGFVLVPGNGYFNTSDFCVMKYEAKIAGNDNGNTTYSASMVPESRTSGTPWVGISQSQAAASAAKVAGCTDCHIMTEAEWMTLMANILSVPSNWSSGVVGSGYLYQGHVNNSPANSLAAGSDSQPTFGITGGTGSVSGTNSQRTFTLSNGNVVWDIIGNVREWTNLTGDSSLLPAGYGDLRTITDWGGLTFPTVGPLNSIAALSDAMNPNFASATNWIADNGMGRFFGYSGSSIDGSVRGGDWASTSDAGAFYIDLSNSASLQVASIGFRVAASAD